MMNTELEKRATMPEGERLSIKWDAAAVRSFYLEELKSVRAEADRHSDETRIMERYVLGACGAIYAFLFTQLDKLQSWPSRFIWWLPLFLMMWGTLRSLALYHHNRQCCSYLENVEKKMQIADWTGWEHWAWSEEQKTHFLRNTAIAVWALSFCDICDRNCGQLSDNPALREPLSRAP